jgi:hypothetical protein
MLPRVRRAILLATALAAAAALSAAAATPTPQTLALTLLKTPFADSELPTGFSTATVSTQAPSANGKRYHVISEIEFDVIGPDAADVIDYYVFPAAADAGGDFQHPDRNGEKVTVVGKVAGMTLPSWEITGSLSGKNALGVEVTDGVTAMAVQSGNVIVTSASVAASSTKHGNEAHALTLLKTALAHLKTVEH